MSAPEPQQQLPATEDAAWIQNVMRLPRARMLVDHLASFDATIACGGVKGIEPPSEQTSTWRRIFCHDYSRKNTPLGIPVRSTGKLPKCVGILNLSGKHCIYYTESYTLCKVVCLSCQQVQPEIIAGINAVIEKAEEMDAGILFCFCLPFQVGLERAHWDVRTIRKTSKGAVKDGELCFSSGDGETRTVPCTNPLDTWPDVVLHELVRKLTSTASPVCLDREEGEDTSVWKTPEAMEAMMEMLKSNRRKMIEEHALELKSIKQDHEVSLAKTLGRAEEAEQDAAIRIAKVAHASKTAEDVKQKKMEHLQTHNATLREQLLTQQKLALEAKASLAGYKLETEQQIKQCAARQQTLEAQVAKLKSDQARQTSEQARVLKERDRKHENALAALVAANEELKSNIKSITAASRAVQASSKQAHSELTAIKSDISRKDAYHAALQKKYRVLRALMSVACMRVEVERETAASNATLLTAQDIAMKDSDRRFKGLEAESNATIASLRACLAQYDKEAPPPDATDQGAELKEKLKESMRELGRKEHLLKEMEKRTASLEKQLYESDVEVKRLKERDGSGKPMYRTAPPATPITTRDDTAKGGKANKRDAKVSPVPDHGAKNSAHSTVNVSQNTAVFMSHPPPPHNQAFPTSHFVIDPHLENTISTLHTALNCITAMARSSSASSKQAELAQAKLDALSCFGIGTQPQYYDSPMYPPAASGHTYRHR